MKQTIILVCVVLTFLKISTTYGWDTTAAKFYPLSVGNYYVFESKHLIMNCAYVEYTNYYTAEIVSDTVFPNGKKYFKFESNFYLWLSDWTYQRIDSNTMNVYGTYSSASSEILLDSLFANKGNTYLGKRNIFGIGSCIVNDTTSQYLLNGTRRIKHIISGGAITMYYSLLEGIGFYNQSDCELGEGNINTLKGCIINGVLYGDTSLTGIQQISSEIPSKYKLHQNYPNPFNPSTSIRYDLQKSGNVVLKVYDISGKEVKTLVNQFQNAGSYIVHFDSKRMASGVYFYRLQTEGFIETKKMVLIK